jgi:hypothetical protein
MKPTVYIETTIIGYLAMRVSGVLRIAANQQTTREWWDNHRERFDLLISRFVVDECSGGDPLAAQERLAYLQDVPLLAIPNEVNGVEYLLTWNCKHIANPSMRPRIERICRDRGFEPPVICTPQELLEIDDAI